MKLDYSELFLALFDDLGVDKTTTSYIMKRLRNEGIHVVTVLLPAFSKHVIMCLEKGEWCDFSSAITKYRGLPVIFRGFLLKLFSFSRDKNKFVVRPDVDPVSILIIRQACEYFYKLSLDFTDEQLEKAEQKFVENDDAVLTDGDYDVSFVDLMRSNFETYYPRSSRIAYDDIIGNARPGSGTFSGYTDFWSRYNYGQYEWYERNNLPATVPPEARNLSWAFRLNSRAPKAKVADLDPDFSEVLFVPKDSRGPRVICREPYSKLVYQLGFFDLFTDCLEKDTQHRINFASQEINRRLAHQSSIDRSYATLDLSDASDMVSYHIVRRLFRFVPFYKIFRFRTTFARLPSGRIRELKKLAGMGSGFTFPTMALIIHLAICTRVSRRFNVDYRFASSKVYVYGDDIIVPKGWYAEAVKALTLVGLKVNTNKSFTNSFFRESCGGDYFYGNDVTPVRCKLTGTSVRIRKLEMSFFDEGSRSERTTSKEYRSILALERHARELVKKQLYSASGVIYACLTSVLGPLPYVSGNSEVLGIYIDSDRHHSMLETDETGTYKELDVWVVRPERVTTRGACPYRYLINALSGKSKTWVDTIFPNDTRTEYGVTTVPRKVRLQRITVSSLALT